MTDQLEVYLFNEIKKKKYELRQLENLKKKVCGKNDRRKTRVKH